MNKKLTRKQNKQHAEGSRMAGTYDQMMMAFKSDRITGEWSTRASACSIHCRWREDVHCIYWHRISQFHIHQAWIRVKKTRSFQLIMSTAANEKEPPSADPGGPEADTPGRVITSFLNNALMLNPSFALVSVNRTCSSLDFSSPSSTVTCLLSAKSVLLPT